MGETTTDDDGSSLRRRKKNIHPANALLNNNDSQNKFAIPLEMNIGASKTFKSGDPISILQDVAVGTGRSANNVTYFKLITSPS